MRTGRLSISRGHQLGSGAGPVDRAPPPAPTAAPPREAAPLTEEPPLARIEALERLARLHRDGALTLDEFASEKARLLRPPLQELLLDDPLPPPRHFVPYQRRQPAGPSLFARTKWLILAGLLIGGGISFAAQPQETMRFIDRTVQSLR